MDTLRPDDHFMVLLESDATPMHIGSLLTVEVPAAQRADAVAHLRRHLVERLPGTPLLRVLRRAPLGFDSDVWVPAPDVDLDRHVTVHPSSAALTDADLHAFVAQQVMTRLDLADPPFRVQILPDVTGGRMALYVRVHHCVADGVGFQTILGLLSDDPVDGPTSTATTAALPGRHEWLRASASAFRADRVNVAERAARRRAAVEALRDPELQRPPTPQCSLSGPISTSRRYTTITVPFDDLRRTATALDATVNDLFLAAVGTALREHLLADGEVPDEPLVTNSARSYRRPEHGSFGNRIVAIHPHLATHLADPLDRLRAVQRSMAVERLRTGYDEALLDQPETPFGPFLRRRRFAARHGTGASILPGNVTVSNVPGPAHERSYAGLRQLSNHPAPLLGSGRALNFTARRNAGSFDVGLMADGAKVDDVEPIAERFRGALSTYGLLVTNGARQ